MSNRRDLIKIILLEKNKNYVSAVHILNSQDKMDIAKISYYFPKYGTGNTYIKITRSPECWLKIQILTSSPDPLYQSFFEESSRIHILNKHLYPSVIIYMPYLRTIALTLDFFPPSMLDPWQKLANCQRFFFSTNIGG